MEFILQAQSWIGDIARWNASLAADMGVPAGFFATGLASLAFYACFAAGEAVRVVRSW